MGERFKTLMGSGALIFVVLIVIGLSTEQSIAKLFYGGIGAGLVLTLFERILGAAPGSIERPGAEFSKAIAVFAGAASTAGRLP